MEVCYHQLFFPWEYGQYGHSNVDQMFVDELWLVHKASLGVIPFITLCGD